MIFLNLPERKLDFDRDQITENKREKESEEYLGCTFIRSNPDENDFSVYDGLGKMQTFIDKLKYEELKETKRWN